MFLVNYESGVSCQALEVDENDWYDFLNKVYNWNNLSDFEKDDVIEEAKYEYFNSHDGYNQPYEIMKTFDSHIEWE